MRELPLHDAIRRFLEYCEVERGRTTATVRMYASVLERFAAYAQRAHVRTTDGVTLECIRQFRLWLHRRPGRSGASVSRATEHLHLVVLRAFLKYLAACDIPSLAAEKVELPKLEDRQVEFLEPDDVERLLVAPIAATANPTLLRLRDAAILEVLFSTGLRVGELVRLTREEVNLDREEFAVRGKGGKVRVVFLSSAAKERLQRYLATRRDPSPFLFVRHDRAARDSGPSVRSSGRADTAPLTARSVERLVARYARMAGIVKPVHPHTLRHSFATDLLRNGAQLRDVQAMLGHASVTTTQVYTHVTERHLKEIHQQYHHQSAANDERVDGRALPDPERGVSKRPREREGVPRGNRKVPPR